MCRFLETICLKNGVLLHLDLHQARLNHVQESVFGSQLEHINLSEVISVDNDQLEGVFKCRVLYDTHLRQIEITPYVMREVNSLKIVHCDTISYDHKAENRDLINQLSLQKADCDDIIIVKNGLLTDTSYANLLFFNGRNWVTPASPLLKGTQRAYLLNENRIEERNIRVEDLYLYHKVRLINAMIDFETQLDISTSRIT